MLVTLVCDDDLVVPAHRVLGDPQVGQLERRVAEAVTERVEGARRFVDVVADRVGPPARGLVRVEDGHLAHRPRIGDGELPARIGLAAQHVGDRGRAFLAGEPRHDDRRAMLVDPRARRRAPRHEHQDDRRARRQHGADELLLDARKIERRPVAELAARAVLGEPRLVAHDQHRDVGGGGQLDRLGETGVGRACDVAAASERHAWSRSAHGARRAPTATRSPPGAISADSTPGVERRAAPAVEHVPQRLDVGRVRVVAEQIAGRVRIRADHGDRPDTGGQRQNPVVAQQHDALAGDRARELAVRRRRCCRGRGGGVDVRLVEEAEVELRAQNPPHRLVERLLGEEPGADRAQQRGAVAVGRGQLDIETGPERQHRGALAVRRQPVIVGELPDREVVGRRRSLRTPTRPAAFR